MNKKSESIKKWRKKTKLRMVQSMGGKCQICKYDKCLDALEFHHVDPSKKDLIFGKVIANPTAWHKISHELNKCILLCCRCHREHHAGILNLPENYQKFDDSLIIDKIEYHPCKVCGKDAPISQKTCSKSCCGKLSGSIDWNSIDLIKELKETSLNYVADKYDISLFSITRRLRKMGVDLKVLRKSNPTECQIKGYESSALLRRKVARPSKQELEKLVWEKPSTRIAKIFGVSDTTIKKWCKFYGISKPPRGHWQKMLVVGLPTHAD